MTDGVDRGRHRCIDFIIFWNLFIIATTPSILPLSTLHLLRDWRLIISRICPIQIRYRNFTHRQDDPPNPTNLPPLPIHPHHAKTPNSHLRRPSSTTTTKSTPSRPHLHSISTIYSILITFSQTKIKRSTSI